MRPADIKVGEEYAIAGDCHGVVEIGKDGPRRILSRGTVLEVVYGRGERADGVRVRITERPGSKLETPQEDVVQTRLIVRPWAEHEEVYARQLAYEEAQRAARVANREKKAKLVAYAEERLGYQLACAGYSPGNITLTLDEVEDLLNWSDQ